VSLLIPDLAFRVPHMVWIYALGRPITKIPPKIWQKTQQANFVLRAARIFAP